MRKFCLKSLNSLLEEELPTGVGLILPAIEESRLYNMEKNPEIKGSGERTWHIRKKDKMKITKTPTKYKTGYAEYSIQLSANLPA